MLRVADIDDELQRQKQKDRTLHSSYSPKKVVNTNTKINTSQSPVDKNKKSNYEYKKTPEVNNIDEINEELLKEIEMKEEMRRDDELIGVQFLFLLFFSASHSLEYFNDTYFTLSLHSNHDMSASSKRFSFLSIYLFYFN
jgi:hypothetical protein